MYDCFIVVVNDDSQDFEFYSKLLLQPIYVIS